MQYKFWQYILIVLICGLSSVSFAVADKMPLDEILPDVAYKRKADHTYVFPNAQLTYSLGESDYLHHWIDRPLLVDPSLDENVYTASYSMTGYADRPEKPHPPLMSLSAYAAMQDTVKSYGLDGLGFLPNTLSRLGFFDYTEKNNKDNFLLLPTLISTEPDSTYAEVIKRALETPQTLRLNNKVVVLCSRGSKNLAQWKVVIADLRKLYGRDFLVIMPAPPLSSWKTAFDDNKITTDDIEKIKQEIRPWLRIADGLIGQDISSYRDKDRIFQPEFYRDFVIRLYKSVLAEPEFKDKLLVLKAKIGHENNTRFGYTFSSNGTKTLRDSMEAAISANPDIINIYEWDEQNENTSLRPTIYNGYSTKRIMRYYAAKLRGWKLEALPGDNLSLPNLTVSYRKSLALGEKLDIELLNIPDGSMPEDYSVEVLLEDGKKNIIYKSAPQKLSAGKLKDQTISLASENFADHLILIPKLIVHYKGQAIPVSAGLHYIHLRTSNWDYKWVKQPIRDLLIPDKSTFDLSSPDQQGQRIVSASFSVAEPLRHVEILDNDDVVYSYAEDETWRNTKDHIILQLSWGAYGGVNINGKISLKNAHPKWRFPDQLTLMPMLKDNALTFRKLPATKRRRSLLISIPRLEASSAYFDIYIPGIYVGKLQLRDLLERTIYGIPGNRGLNLVFSHYTSQDRIPHLINKTNVSFTVPVVPRTPNSVFHLQAVGISGRLYRSSPVMLNTGITDKSQIAVYSLTQRKVVKLTVPRSHVPDIRYQFTPSHGSVLVADAGRPFWGILGGYFAQATGRGGGNAGDDSPFIYGYGGRKLLSNNTQKTAPDWVNIGNGEYALEFDGASTHISLPQDAIPRFSGYTIQMDINPDTIAGTQNIISHASHYTGSIRVYIAEGKIKLRYAGQYSGSTDLLDSGLNVPAQKWSNIKIRFDQETIQVFVDGRAGKVLETKGPGVYDTATSIGGFATAWFKGKVKSLRILHSID